MTGLLLIGGIILFNSPFKNINNKNNWGFNNDAPIAATKIINEQKEPLVIFNQWELGSYLTLHQKNKIFIDSRNIIYTREIFDQYKRLIRCRINCSQLLEQFNINTVLLRKENFPLIESLKLLLNWEISYEDDMFILFFRRG